MTELANESCEACRADAPKLTAEELAYLLPQIPEWTLLDDNGVQKLARQFSFKNFAEAMAFASRVGELAEENNHHPVLTVEWGEAEVVWWTHKIDGLHKNDLVLVAKTDALYGES